MDPLRPRTLVAVDKERGEEGGRPASDTLMPHESQSEIVVSGSIVADEEFSESK